LPIELDNYGCYTNYDQFGGFQTQQPRWLKGVSWLTIW
jgi:hypothetical protein